MVIIEFQSLFHCSFVSLYSTCNRSNFRAWVCFQDNRAAYTHDAGVRWGRKKRYTSNV